MYYSRPLANKLTTEKGNYSTMTDLKETPIQVVGIPRDKAPEPTLGDDPIILGERYYSPDFAKQEWEKMWTRVWQIAGRVDQIPEPGDYVCYEIMHESIICVRGEDSQIRAFYNACQHLSLIHI